MKSPYLLKLPVIFLIIGCSSILAHKTSDLNVILRICDPTSGLGNCFTNESYTGKEYYRKALKLISGGIFQLLIENLENVIKVSKVSSTCATGLQKTKDGIMSGKHKDFQMLDASAKMPSSFLESTITSMGDYDECLAVDNHGFTGKYCMVDVFPLRPQEHVWRKDILHFGKYSFFNGTAYFFGLCFPSTCSEDDVRSLTQNVLKDHPLSVTGEVSCVTREDVSLLNRILSITIGQAISILLIGSFVAAVGFASFLDSFRFIGYDIETHIPDFMKTRTKEFIETFSMFVTLAELVEEKASKKKDAGRLAFIDWIKLAIVLAGVNGHCMSCLETPLGFFVTDKHHMFTIVFTNPLTQFIFNDGGLGWVTLLSGFSTFLLLQPLIEENRLNFKIAIFDRWIRFAPVVLAITCMDFVWPLILNGPFHSRVASWISNKCGNNWWWNIPLISIFFPALEICAPHTYYASVDLMMFLLGLAVITLLVKKPFLGVLTSTAMMALGVSLMMYYTALFEVPPAVMLNHIRAQKVVDYLDTMQMSLYAFFNNYFLGVLIAYFLKQGFVLKINSAKEHVFWIGLIGLSMILAETSPALHNTFDVIPQSLVPYYIVFNRACFTATITFLVVYAASVTDTGLFKAKTKAKKTDSDKNEEVLTTPSEVIDDTDGFSRIKDLCIGMQDAFLSRFATALTRLSFAIFVSNYWFIRSDFFYSRTTFENDYYPVSKRLVVYFFFIIIFACIFHILFVSPIDKLRKKLDYKITTSTKTTIRHQNSSQEDSSVAHPA